MTTGSKCAADARCRHPAPLQTGICGQHRQQARLAQMQQSPSPAVRAAARMLAGLHQGERETDGDELRRRWPSPAAREAEPG